MLRPQGLDVLVNKDQEIFPGVHSNILLFFSANVARRGPHISA